MSIDLSAVNDEDQVSKVDLAHEIERTRAIIHSCDQELQTQLDQFQDKVTKAKQDLADANRLILDPQKKEISDLVEKAAADMERDSSLLIENIKKLMEGNTSLIEEKIKSIDIELDRKVRAEVNRELDSIQKNQKDFSNELSEQKRNTMMVMNKYQAEIREKISSCLMQFKLIRTKFVELAKLLS